MNGSNDNIRVVIPLNIRRRNGRPKILPPENVAEQQVRAQDPHILKALGRAWAWRRRLESGDIGTAGDLARSERLSERFVSRTMRLAFLSPSVLDNLVLLRTPPSCSLAEVIEAASLSWTSQNSQVFDIRTTPPNNDMIM